LSSPHFPYTTLFRSEQFSTIIDKQISSTITEKGETIAVDLPTSFASQGFDASSFSKMSPSFPDKAVTPGESWESSSDVAENPLLDRKSTRLNSSHVK